MISVSAVTVFCNELYVVSSHRLVSPSLAEVSPVLHRHPLEDIHLYWRLHS